ncbi:hypothetical protein GCM10022393_08260 [Aquimarina addita]|uniref:ATP-dependent DNA ligase n=1 Tax=Aquimarina addita TaxID=870485 RepID=A0ABP7XBX7_9FLAO
MKAEQITLYFKQGGSDKVYKAHLEEKDGMYIVNFAYGRRGATLKTGTKTQSGVVYEKAKKIYDKLVNDKSAKGYVPDENSTKYVYAEDQVHSGIYCQLLNPVDKSYIQGCITEDSWWAQEKKDGRRMLIRKTKEITAINRRGLTIGAPESILNAAKLIEQQFIVDGEAVGEILYVFDLLFWNGEDIRERSYKERLNLLLAVGFRDAIKVIKTTKNSKEKEELYQQLMKTDSEGVVFKKHRAVYTAGRPNSGGTQIKFKFYDTASVIVSKVNDKRSVAMIVYDGSKEIAIGNVTISSNKEIPETGAIIEVRYLYAYKGGSLYQPTFLHLRTDIEKKECTIDQLKYKNISQ